MDLNSYKEEILLKLGGGVVSIELEKDGLLEKIIMSAFREIHRYINITKLVTVPFQKVMDLSKLNVSSINQVYRVNAVGQVEQNVNTMADPFYLSMISSGSFGLGSDMLHNYAAYMTRRQQSNTLSTDLRFYWDVTTKKLYINAPYPVPTQVTIDYIPLFTDISEIDEPFWVDMLVRLSLALAKETLGRIRGKYTLNNALYDLDAEQLLAEGREELTQIREYLATNSDTIYPID